MTESYYDILGVTKNASLKEIRKAYKKLAKKWHPDKNPDNMEMATQKFKDMREAFEVLKDPQKRQMYDTHGKDGLKESGFNVNDIFSNLFKHQHRRVISSVKCIVELTLEELYCGKKIRQEINRHSLCKKCNSTGNVDKKPHKCMTCNGQGVVIQMFSIGPGRIQQMQRPCHICKGTGRNTNVQKCDKCKGNCVINEKHTIEIDIKPGLVNGNRIGVENCGNEIPSDANTYTRGMVEIIIKEIPHPVFKRNMVMNGGHINPANLFMELDISLSEALCGFVRTFEHLDKRKLYIHENYVISDNEIKIIPNEGMVIPNNFNNKRGDLYIKYNVIYPTNISNSKKKILFQCLTGTPYKKPIFPQKYAKLETMKVNVAKHEEEENHENIPQECIIQ